MFGLFRKLIGRNPAGTAESEPTPIPIPIGRRRAVLELRPQQGKRGKWRWAARFANDKEPYCVMEIRGAVSETAAVAHALIMADAEIRVYDAQGRRVRAVFRDPEGRPNHIGRDRP